jgi:hypothetical protein
MILINPQPFWDKFLLNQEKLKYPSRFTPEEYQRWHRGLTDDLRMRTLEFLFTEIIVDEQHHAARMIVSAHGNTKCFEAVELIILSAPVIEGWEFVAFYPPAPAASWARHNYPSITTRPEEMFFSPSELVPVAGRYNLVLYVPQNVSINTALTGAATQMMFNILGEKTGGLYIRKVILCSLAEVSQQTQQTLLPFTELPAHISLDGCSVLSVTKKGGIKPWRGE